MAGRILPRLPLVGLALAAVVGILAAEYLSSGTRLVLVLALAALTACGVNVSGLDLNTSAMETM
jgi:hypothetical protein